MNSKAATPASQLSLAERQDLDRLIRASRSRPVKPESSQLEEELESLRKQHTTLAETVRDLDRRLSLVFEIVQLTQARNEMIDGRIEALSGRSKPAPGGK